MSIVLGVRCSASDYSFVVLGGTRQGPVVLEKGLVGYPKEYSWGEALNWQYQEFDALIMKHSVIAVVVKGTEPMARKDKSYTARVEREAIVALVAARLGVQNVKRKVKATLAKDLGMKGRAKYLSSDKLDTSLLPGFDDESDKSQEAFLAAWSEM